MTAHGGDIYGERPVRLDFSVNVNPMGTPEPVLQAARDSIADCSCYPDIRCGALRKAVSRWYGVPEEELIFSNGAAELIFSVVRAVRPKKAVLLAPSFLEYEIALNSIGTEIKYFYLKEEDGFAVQVKQYLDFLEERKPELIFLCNPANPSGTVMDWTDLKEILDFCGRERIFAVVDECFLEFLDVPEKRSALQAVKAGADHVMVIQAPTKTFALAGLRLGYGFLNNRRLLEKMVCSAQPWNVSIPAQAAGAAAFGPGREIFLERTREFLREEKPFLIKGLEEKGFRVYGGGANYLLFKDLPGKEPDRLLPAFLELGILIRGCGNYRGLDGTYYRICVKKRRYNQEFLEIIKRHL